ncbi:MAG: hypothetical protein R3F61_24750 [Myxococcota bacterium]
MIALTTLFALGAAPTAQASIYMGNPTTEFRIDRSNGDLTDGDVYVYKVRVHACDGSYTDYSVKQWVDPVAGYGKTINGGDLCSATWYWGSDVVLDGPGFTIVATPDQTTVSLDPLKTVDVLPWYVAEGTLPNQSSVVLIPSMD